MHIATQGLNQSHHIFGISTTSPGDFINENIGNV